MVIDLGLVPRPPPQTSDCLSSLRLLWSGLVWSILLCYVIVLAAAAAAVTFNETTTKPCFGARKKCRRRHRCC